MFQIKLDMVQTIGLSVVLLIIGQYLKHYVKIFQKYCIPSPVIGGFLFAAISFGLHHANILMFDFDATLQKFFMTMFFTSIGFNASWKILKRGGTKVFIFLILAILLVICQNIVAVGISKLLGINPLLGLLTGSAAMTGGHGTAAAMAPSIEALGIESAKSVAIAAATFGLVAGSTLGGPLAQRLIQKKKLVIEAEQTKEDASGLIDGHVKDLNGENFAKAFFIILISMFIGSYLSEYLNQFLSFPAYIGPMLIAAILRNIADGTALFDIHYEEIHIIEDVSLNLFLGVAMMTLKFWELSSVAGALIVLLLAQAVLAYLFTYYITFKIMGANYDAAVMASGHVGFGLGSTANGIANMQSISQKYVHSPLAFFVIPIIGALFIDFFNVAIITTFISFFS